MLALLNSPLGFASTPHHEKEKNPCDGMKYASTLNSKDVVGDLDTSKGLPNLPCFEDDSDVSAVEPQSAADVTVGKVTGAIDTTHMPAIEGDMEDMGLCAVNVHWHEGAEHRSEGQYEEKFTGPGLGYEGYHGPGDRKLAEGGQTQGHHCLHYETMTEDQKKPYEFKYCHNMHVGETYEVHWPHSAAGMCGTKWQMQSPFYDGVLCNDAGVVGVFTSEDSEGQPNTLNNLAQAVGVEGQVFTIVNDAAYDMDLNMYGAIKDPDRGLWADVAYYTGSTTGQSRDNKDFCSLYTPITWQVDRTCHMISAKSFDDLCETMVHNAIEGDNFEDGHDLAPHGARRTVPPELTGSNIEDGAARA
jgi:hypothetical protein